MKLELNDKQLKVLEIAVDALSNNSDWLLDVTEVDADEMVNTAFELQTIIKSNQNTQTQLFVPKGLNSWEGIK